MVTDQHPGGVGCSERSNPFGGMDVSVAVHDDPELVTAVRVQAAHLSVLGALADLASDPLDLQRAHAMRQALNEADEVRPLLQHMRQAARQRPHLTLLPRPDQEDAR